MKNTGEIIYLQPSESISLFSAHDRKEDTPGCGFEAESYSRFNLFTSYIQLPSVSIDNDNEIGYFLLVELYTEIVFILILDYAKDNIIGNHLL